MRCLPPSDDVNTPVPSCCSSRSRRTPLSLTGAGDDALYRHTQARLRAAEQSVANALTGVPETVLATGDVRDGDPAEQLLEVSRDEICCSSGLMVAAA